MNVEQQAIRFPCNGDMLYGVLSIPEQRTGRGVLVVVGGPQYRAGSHRQFALLARFLAQHGTAVMRFDYRGMGDSEGEPQTFEDIGDDIRCAIDHFHSRIPELREVVIWGLCDAASAALFYAQSDPRVAGLVLLNPWVRTEHGAARTYLRHYYTQRLVDREFWAKLLRFRFNIIDSGRSFLQIAAKSLTRSIRMVGQHGGVSAEADDPALPLPERMLVGFRRFPGPVLLILSGNDLTAKEFIECARKSAEWTKLLGADRVRTHHVPEANHTFARCEWRDEVAEWTRAWLESW